MVKKFYQSYYKSNTRRLILCGINSGRLGAGKTGVPFLDYQALSKMIPLVKNHDSERSAQFGDIDFFEKVYLTNVSWFGFIKGQKNLNYYELEPYLQNEFIRGFVREMEFVQPIGIVPLSEEVENTLK